MRTLIVADQYRNQYYNKNWVYGPVLFGSCGYPTSGDFRGINCRTYQSGAGIIPTPLKSSITPVTERAFPSSSSHETPSTLNSYLKDDNKSSKRSLGSSAMPVPLKIGVDSHNEDSSYDFSYSERWAGPAYSNSPPPSSLPIPNFSVRPTKTISLDLPLSPSNVDLLPISKSARSSPTMQCNPSTISWFSSPDSATMNLRRILNLDICDD